MKKFEIVNATSGVVLGVFEAETEADALDAMARDAGYEDYAAARAIVEKEFPSQLDATFSDLLVTEIDG